MAVARKTERTGSGGKRSLSVPAILLAIVVIAALGVIVFKKVHKPSNSAPPSKLTSKQLQQIANDNASTKEQALENPPQQSTPPPTPSDSSITLSAQKGANDTETIIADLGNVADGTCTITITNGAQHTTQTAAVLYQPQSSSCEGFNIPISAVGTGTWTITLDVSSNGTTATKTTTEVVQ